MNEDSTNIHESSKSFQENTTEKVDGNEEYRRLFDVTPIWVTNDETPIGVSNEETPISTTIDDPVSDTKKYGIETPKTFPSNPRTTRSSERDKEMSNKRNTRSSNETTTKCRRCLDHFAPEY